MRIFTIIFVLATTLVGLSSCQKNIDTFIPDPTPSTLDTVWQNNLPASASITSLKNELRIAATTDSFSYANTGIVFSSGNISLGIPANGLAKNNGLVPSGIVNRETLLTHKKGDFIAMDMPTTSQGRLLITGGAFFIGLKNNGDELLVSQGNKLTVKFNSNLPVAGNKIFNASIDSANGFTWLQNNDTVYNRSGITNTGYEIQTNKLKYVQTAYYFDTTGIAQTFVSLKLPSNYTNTNTAAYISFNNMECVAALNANVNTRTFVSTALPVNKVATIVVISKQAGDYYFGTQQITTTGSTVGSINQTVLFSPTKKSLQFIKAYLSNL